MIDIKKEISEEVSKLELENSTDEEILSLPEGSEQLELSDFELRMQKKGWDPAGEKDAQQWLDDGFEIRGKRVDTLYKTVDYLKDKFQREEKLAYERAIADLKAEKVKAIQARDVNKVEELEQKQAHLTNSSDQGLIDDFKYRNREWLEGTSYNQLKMAESFLKKDIELTSRRLPTEKHIEAIENYMNGEFPDYFKKSQVEAPPNVEGGQSSVVKSRKKVFTVNDLDDIQKSIARTLEKKGVMKIEDYIQDQIKLGNLK